MPSCCVRRKAGVILPGLFLFPFLFLTACAPDGVDSSLSNYLSRLANVAGYEGEPAVKPLPVVRFPASVSSESKTSGSAQATIGLLDFLAMGGCQLQQLVAHRNSGLGKFSQPSQKLLYTLQFLHFAPVCMDSLEPGDPLVEELEQAWQQKRRDLPEMLVNSLLLGPDARSFWKVPRETHGYPEQIGAELPEALKRLHHLVQRWLAGDYQAGWNHLESLLFQFQSGEGGQLYSTLLRFRSALDAGNRILRSRSEHWCARGQPTINVRAANNIVTKFFVGDVQPWAAILSRRYYAVIEPYERIEMLLEPHLPEGYLRWRATRQNAMHLALEAAKPHVTLLQRLMEPCGLNNEARRTP